MYKSNVCTPGWHPILPLWMSSGGRPSAFLEISIEQLMAKKWWTGFLLVRLKPAGLNASRVLL